MQSVYLNGGYIGSTREYATPYEPISDFTLIDSVDSAVTSGSISFTIPASAQAGDLCILTQAIDEEQTIGDVPTGFTLLAAADPTPNGGNCTGILSYKVLTSDDLGATFTDSNYTAEQQWLIAAIFRPVSGSLKPVILPSDIAGDATTGNPASQTINADVSSGPLISLAHMSNRSGQQLTGVSTSNWDDYISYPVDGQVNRQRLYYKIYDSLTTPANSTADIGDNGAQVLQSLFLKFTSERGIKSYNSGIWNLESALDSVSAGKTIVQDQLIFWIDPSVQESYPGYNSYVNDLSGNHATFTVQNGASFNSDPGSFSFDGTDDRLSGVGWAIPTGSFSLSVWFRGTGSSQLTDFSSVVSKSGGTVSNTGNYGFYSGLAGTPTVRFSFNNGTTTYSINSTVSDWDDNVWVNYVGVYDSTTDTGYLYRNGVFNNSGSMIGPPATSTSSPVLIGDREQVRPYLGEVGEVLLYNKALTAGEVYTNYSVSKGKYAS